MAVLLCRYDGYKQSLESAAANIAEGEEELRRRRRSLSSVAPGLVTQRRREQLKEGLKTVGRCLHLLMPVTHQILVARVLLRQLEQLMYSILGRAV